MRRTPRLFLPFVASILFSACSDSAGSAIDPGEVTASPVLGQMAFSQSCSGCHASADGFDLKIFAFSDTTIIRRAVKHVDTATARNIVAYIQSVQAPPNNASFRLFQPKGVALASDAEFAIALFGRDAWPDDMTTSKLLSIDPRNVQIAVQLPVWADEKSNMDWMPDFVLPAGILDYAGGLARGAIAGYNAAPTTDNLVRAVNALRSADRATANADAPCLLEDTLRVKWRECFEVRRWTSSLVAMHMLRFGLTSPLKDRMQDVWWDVGNAARKSRTDKTVPIANADQNWVKWMFLGWSFDPSLHSTSYTGGGFKQIGLMRHATFVALRSEVARPKNSASVYEDVMNAAKFAPATWTMSATSFGLRHLDERLKGGDRPTDAAARATAITQVNSAVTEAGKKVSAAEKAQLQALANPVLTALQ
jgi:hypothetical protein